MRGAVTLLVVALLATSAHPAKILCLFGFSGKSHTHVFGALTSELARRGHDITVVSPFPVKDPPGKFRHVDVPAIRELFNTFDSYDTSDVNIFKTMMMIFDMAAMTCPEILKIPEVKSLLNEKFDLVIISIFFNECTLPFAHHNNAPFVLISPTGSAGWNSESMGNSEPSAYVPNLFLSFSDHMDFWQRFFNALVGNFILTARKLVHLPRMDVAAREFFGEQTPPISELERNASLALLNNHVSLNYPRPLLPNEIEVGGMHVSQNTQPLPQDIQEFLDGAKDGVIYFSMGSMLRGDRLPPDKRQAFLEAFSELPQRVLWKWESDTMPGQPANVKLGKWLPQQDILAHPNVRLFITHGGLLSAQEASYHGVPLVGIPVSGDQELNVRRAEVLGVAVKVEFRDISRGSLLAAINTVLGTASFKEAADSLMRRMRDQPQTPLDRAVFWTEYVIRHKGASHLRSAALDLAWYQLYLLDVAAAILVTLLLLLLALRGVLRLCCGGDKKPENHDKKKK